MRPLGKLELRIPDIYPSSSVNAASLMWPRQHAFSIGLLPGQHEAEQGSMKVKGRGKKDESVKKQEITVGTRGRKRWRTGEERDKMGIKCNNVTRSVWRSG